MEQTATIRDELFAYMSKKDITINKFAEITGVHSGTLNRVMKGEQAFAMNHLEKVTKTLGLAEDYFYEKYVVECLYTFAPTWRRIRPFIERCADLDRMDCIERLVEGLLDDLNYAPMLFELAEELFEQKKWQAAAILYENVALSEKFQHSERLALCKFRLFTINTGDDPKQNLIQAALFEPYVDRLEEVYQLDALKYLLNTYSALGQWDKANQFANKMLKLAKIQYELLKKQYHQRDKSGESNKKAVYKYILYAELMISAIYENMGDYKTALRLIPNYTDFSWIREKDEEAQLTIKQFQEWGKANTYLYRLQDGQIEVLEEYVEYVSTQENEIFTALFKIVETANRYHWNVDHIIERFSDYIPNRDYYSVFTKRNKQIQDSSYTRFQNELAKYYLTRKHIDLDEISLAGAELTATFDAGRNVIKGKLSVEFEVEF
ncbi:helix-turn-helix domain-containing protein [Paenibacillus tengchongensis]|uniref:helix-turn-helix domain-containing protein n=1 Tax=Paenibacillus tengchongensis TaxID=2608684 RepID=UPI00124F354E|nr:helix-turn-helix transcriptional regulator [Paenibacillus tengchongensis]